MRVFRSLSGRLLILTVLFVMLAEVFIFVPSLARFRVDYLRERLSAANIVSIALLEGESTIIDPRLEGQLLASAEVRSIALARDGTRLPLLYGDWTEPVEHTFNLETESIFDQIGNAIACLMGFNAGRVIRVMGSPEEARNPMGDLVEITMRESQLRDAMIAFALRVLVLSLVISLVTAMLVYLTLNRWIVKPIRKLIGAMTTFRKAPESAPIIAPGMSGTEIAEAEGELASMQTELRQALKQKTRLAALGEAVAKVNHDLRNSLSTAQLLTDRLEMSADPMVARTAPKLLRSLDRATALCERTLTFGNAEEANPERRRIMLGSFMEELRDQLVLEAGDGIEIALDVADDAYAEADPDQLHRIVHNLARNAVQAIEAAGAGGVVTLSARRDGQSAEIEVADTGPGLPTVARQNLFKAFKGGVRKGGSGLGLAIAQELAKGHGGEVALIDSTTGGTRFRVSIPDTSNGT